MCLFPDNLADSLQSSCTSGLLRGLPPSGISSRPGGGASLAHPLPVSSVNSLSRQLEQFSQQPKSHRLSSCLKNLAVWTTCDLQCCQRSFQTRYKQKRLLSKGCQREDKPVRRCLGLGSLAVTSPRPFKAGDILNTQNVCPPWCGFTQPPQSNSNRRRGTGFVHWNWKNSLFSLSGFCWRLRPISLHRFEAFEWKTTRSASNDSPGWFQPPAAGAVHRPVMRHRL